MSNKFYLLSEDYDNRRNQNSVKSNYKNKTDNINMNLNKRVSRDSRKRDKKDDTSISKRVLCYNILTSKGCSYGNKCMYAHSLNEQKIDSIRHKVYTILKKDDDLSTLDIINDKKLFETLVQLTKVCSLCMKGVCPGGYNCRHGALDIRFKICYEDLMNGNCKRSKCNCIHLTDRGLKPYLLQKYPSNLIKGPINKGNDQFSKIKESEAKVYPAWKNVPESVYSSTVSDKPGEDKSEYKSDTLSNTEKLSITDKDVKDGCYFYNFLKRKGTDTKSKRNLRNNIEGIKLTDKFFRNSSFSLEDDSFSDSEGTDDDVESIIRFLNSESDSDSDEKSIFEI